MPWLKHEERQTLLRFPLQCVVNLETFYISTNDCFATLQIVYPPCGGRRISPRLIHPP